MVDPLSSMSFATKFKEGMTKSVFRPPVDYTTIEVAKQVKKGSTAPSRKLYGAWDKFVSLLKMGHVIGLGLLGTGAGFFYTAKKFEDTFLAPFFKAYGPLGIIGGAIALLTALFGRNEAEKGVASILDNFAERLTINSADNTSLDQNGNTGRRVFDYRDLVLSRGNRNQMEEVFNTLEKGFGCVVNAAGIIGNGKTSLAEALAGELVRRDICRKALYWNAKDAAFAHTLADDIGPTLLGIIPIGETIIQRVERLVANAVAHHKRTGEYVVISLDEACNLLGLDNRWFSLHSFDTADPHKRSKISSALGRLISDKISTQDCEGVVVVIPTNSNGDDTSDNLGRRMKELTFRNPTQSMREELIKKVVQREIKRRKITGTNPDKLNYSELSRIGTVDLPRLWGNGNRKRGESEAQELGLRGCLPEISAYDVLHCDAITKAVVNALDEYKSGGNQALGRLIKEHLDTRIHDRVISNKKKLVREIRFYSGSNEVRTVLYKEQYSDDDDKKRPSRRRGGRVEVAVD